MKTPAERQKEIVAACRAAMPTFLEPLWETMLHAPNVALEPVVESLNNTLPDPSGRMRVVLEWFGHGGDCPVCWMLTGKIVFSFGEPVVLLGEVVAASSDPLLLDGARRFVRTQFEPRHALPAGVSRERLAELVAELAALPAEVREVLGIVAR